MRAVSWFMFSTILMLGFGCSSRVETVEDLQEFINASRNGLKKEKQIGNVNISITNRPTDLLVDQELGNKTPTKEEVDKLRSKYGKYWYFVLSLSANGDEIENYNIGSQANFGSRIQELAFGMNQNVYMVTSNADTLQMADYHYQRTFGVGNSSDFLLAFDREETKKADELKIVLKDMGLGVGINRFKFELNDLKNAPTLEFN